ALTLGRAHTEKIPRWRDTRSSHGARVGLFQRMYKYSCPLFLFDDNGLATANASHVVAPPAARSSGSPMCSTRRRALAQRRHGNLTGGLARLVLPIFLEPPVRANAGWLYRARGNGQCPAENPARVASNDNDCYHTDRTWTDET